MIKEYACHHCEGKGYIDIRDCSGEIQRCETCSFCEGRGYLEQEPISKHHVILEHDNNTAVIP